MQRPRRLALMNMFLHGVDASETILLGDSIDGEQINVQFDMILSNPPFGSKGSAPTNRKFPIKTSDKQLNFIHHIIEKLKDGGKASIVLPDSCLTSEKAKEIWAFYMDKERSGDSVCNVHTILKLPEGIFAAYANGVRACVIFLEKGQPTETMWMYDARRNTPKVTMKSNPLTNEHFKDFEKSYFQRIESDNFKPHFFAEIQEQGFDLSFVEIVQPEPLRHPVIILDELIIYYESKIRALKELRTKLPLPDNYITHKETNDEVAITPISDKPERKKALASLNGTHA